MMDKIFVLFGSGFYTGRLKGPTGTYGSLAAVILYLIAFRFVNNYIYLILLAGIYFLSYKGAVIIDHMEKSHDSSVVTGDEVIGMLITLWTIPFSFQATIAGFFLFRFFDIIKPFPVGYIDLKMRNSHGVMLDDVLAGFMSLISLRILLWIF